jgi:hypothetical protein
MVKVLFFLALILASVSAFVSPASRAGEFLELFARLCFLEIE